jgi:hypothetical protein
MVKSIIELRYMMFVTFGLIALTWLKVEYIALSTSHHGPFWIGCFEPHAVYLEFDLVFLFGWCLFSQVSGTHKASVQSLPNGGAH